MERPISQRGKLPNADYFTRCSKGRRKKKRRVRFFKPSSWHGRLRLAGSLILTRQSRLHIWGQQKPLLHASGRSSKVVPGQGGYGRMDVHGLHHAPDGAGGLLSGRSWAQRVGRGRLLPPDRGYTQSIKGGYAERINGLGVGGWLLSQGTKAQGADGGLLLDRSDAQSITGWLLPPWGGTQAANWGLLPHWEWDWGSLKRGGGGRRNRRRREERPGSIWGQLSCSHCHGQHCRRGERKRRENKVRDPQLYPFQILRYERKQNPIPTSFCNQKDNLLFKSQTRNLLCLLQHKLKEVQIHFHTKCL